MTTRDEFAALVTEQRNPRSTRLDMMSTSEVVALINDEDAGIAQALRAAVPDIAKAADLVAQRIRDGGRVFYVGSGTSGRIGALDASEWTPTFGTEPRVVQAIMAGGAGIPVEAASELEDDRALGARSVDVMMVGGQDVVIGLAASGRTPYVLGALEAARRLRAATVGISGNPGTPMAPLVDILIVAVVGPEVLTGSTRMKAGTAQKMILNMISTAAMVRLGKVYSNLMVDMRPANRKLLDRARRIVAEATSVSPNTAAEALEAAGGDVKCAIVIAALGCDLPTARRRLQSAGGLVRKALE